MNVLYESKYQVLVYSEKDRLFISEWKPETKNLNDETYLVEIHKLFSFFRRLKPIRYYCDISNLQYELSKDVQDFVANLFKDANARHCAIITNKKDIYPGVEGVVNELQVLSDNFTNRYFFNKEAAMKWLLEAGTKSPIVSKSSLTVANRL